MNGNSASWSPTDAQTLARVAVAHVASDECVGMLIEDLHERANRVRRNSLYVDTDDLTPPNPLEAPAVLCIVGSPGCRNNDMIEQSVRTWLENGGVVIFAFDPRYDFRKVSPALLHRFNGFPMREDGPVGPLSTLLLRLVGLDESERRVFLSYRRGHGEKAALQLRHALLDRGWDVFLDQFAIPPGVDFQKALFRDMDPRSLVLVVETPETRRSTWVDDEIAFAHTHGIGVRALVFPEVLETELRFPPAVSSFLTSDQVVCERNDKANPLLLQEVVDALLCDLQHDNTVAYRTREDDIRLSVEGALTRAGYRFAGLQEATIEAERGEETMIVRVTARRPTVGDLHAVDEARSRSGGSRSRGWVVHRLDDPDPHMIDLLNWAGEPRSIGVVPVMQFRSRLIQ